MTLAAEMRPNFTSVTPVKFVPVMVMLSPPPVLPVLGLSEAIVGRAPTLYVY